MNYPTAAEPRKIAYARPPGEAGRWPDAPAFIKKWQTAFPGEAKAL